MKVNREEKKPRGIVGVLAAVEGFGKTTTLSRIPGAYMVDVDDGSFGLDIPTIEFDGTVNGMLGLCREILDGKAPADMKCLVIDTADRLCDVLAEDLCRRNKWANMEHFDYGKCWSIFKPEWAKVWDALKEVARKAGVSVFTSVHIDGNKTFTDAVTAKQWNRIAMRMTPKCGSVLLECSDLYVTGFYDAEVYEERKGMKKLEVAGSEKRICVSEHSPKCDGKCRGFIRLGGGEPFPKRCTLDRLVSILPDMLAASTVGASAPATKPAEAAEPEEDEPRAERDEEAEAYESNPDYRQLKDLIAQFGIDEGKLRAYVSSKATFGPNPPPWWRCNAKALQWLCKGIAMQKIQPLLK